MRAALDEIQTVLADAIADLRRAIFSLRPLDLEAVGFFRALPQLVADFGDQHQLAAQLEVSGPQDVLPTAYELPLFRIIQQGLNNIGQHARASSALVRLAVDADGGGVTVSVRDNGRGFDPSQLGPANRAGHFGLRQMRERILDLGGTLDVHSAIGQGTELLITLPPVAKEANHQHRFHRALECHLSLVHRSLDSSWACARPANDHLARRDVSDGHGLQLLYLPQELASAALSA
jgi:signal transduction histidine kinase